MAFDNRVEVGQKRVALDTFEETNQTGGCMRMYS